MEKRILTAIIVEKDESMFKITGLSDKPNSLASIFKHIVDSCKNIDLILQNVAIDNQKTSVTFSAKKPDSEDIRSAILSNKDKLSFDELYLYNNIAKISVVGIGIFSSCDIAYKIFDILGKNSINIIAISTSQTKISLLIEVENADKAKTCLNQELLFEEE